MSRGAVILIGVICSAAPLRGQSVPTFVTAATPSLNIGREAGLPYLLQGVADAVRLADGSVVVGACGTADLRIYDSRGVHVRTVGLRGQGSAESQFIRRLFSAGGDSIAVNVRAFALVQHRIDIYTRAGDFIRSVSVPVEAEAIGRTADGQFVLVQPEGYRTPRLDAPPGLHRRTTALYKMSADGVLTDSLVGLPGHEVYVIPDDRIPGSRFPRFRRMPVSAVQPTRIIFGSQDQATFLELSPDLDTRVERETLTRPEPVTAALQEAWVATRSVLAPRGGVLPVYADAYAPSTPAYRDVIAGNDGRTWVQDPELPGWYPLIWTAYLEGRPVARVELPTRFFPFELGTDWVLGAAYDDSGNERVQVFDLTRTELTNRRLSPQDAAPPATPRCGSWSAR